MKKERKRQEKLQQHFTWNNEKNIGYDERTALHFSVFLLLFVNSYPYLFDVIVLIFPLFVWITRCTERKS